MAISISAVTRRVPYGTRGAANFVGFPGMCVDPANGDLLVGFPRKDGTANTVLDNRWLRSSDDGDTWVLDHDEPNYTIHLPSEDNDANGVPLPGIRRTTYTPQPTIKVVKSGGGFEWLRRLNYDDWWGTSPSTGPTNHKSMELEASPNGATGWVKRGPTSLGLSSCAQISRIKPYTGGYLATGQDFRTPVAPNVHKSIRWAKPLMRRLDEGSNGIGDSSTDLLVIPNYLGLNWDGNGTATGNDASRGIVSGQLYSTGGNQASSASKNTRYPTRIFINEYDWAEDKDGHLVMVVRCGGVWDGWAGAQSTKYLFIRCRRQLSGSTWTGKYVWPCPTSATDTSYQKDFFEAPFNPPVPRTGGPVHPALVHFTAGQDDVLVFAARYDANLNPARFYYSINNGVSWVGFAAGITVDNTQDPYYAQISVRSTAQAHIKTLVIVGSSQRDLDPSSTVDFFLTEYQYLVVGTPTTTQPPLAPQLLPAAGSFKDSVTVNISVPAGCVARYTTDGSTPGPSSPIATGNQVTISTLGTTTLRVISFRTADSAVSSPTSGTYTITATPPAPLIPQFSPDGGSFTGSVSVAIIVEDDCSIVYTTNGTVPTLGNGTVISGPIWNVDLTVDTTLKAVAIRSGAPNSPVKTAFYDATVVDPGGGGTGQETTVDGPFRPSAFANDTTVGTRSWSNMGSAVDSNDDKAFVDLPAGAVGNYIRCTALQNDSGLPLSLPNGVDTTTELVLVVEHSQTSASGAAQDNRIVLVKGGTVVSSPVKASSLIYRPEIYGDQAQTYVFDATDLLNFTPADIAATGFGFAVSMKNSASGSSTFGKIDDCYVESVTFASTDVTPPPDPVIQPAGQDLPAGVIGPITISCADPTAKLYYSLSQSTNPNLPPDPLPDLSNYVLYTQPFFTSLADNGIRKVRAAAVDAVGNISTSLVEYDAADVTPPSDVVITPGSGSVTADVGFTVTMTADPDSTIYYTSTLSGTVGNPIPDQAFASGTSTKPVSAIADQVFASGTFSGGTVIADQTFTSGSSSAAVIPPDPLPDLSNYVQYTTAFSTTVPLSQVRRFKAVARDSANNISDPVMVEYSGIPGVLVLPQNIVLPSISGLNYETQVLTADPGTWNAASTPTYSYQWMRNGVAITGAASSTYTLQSVDVAKVITVSVVATVAPYSSLPVVSQPTAMVLPQFGTFSAASDNFEDGVRDTMWGDIAGITETGGRMVLTPAVGTNAQSITDYGYALYNSQIVFDVPQQATGTGETSRVSVEGTSSQGGIVVEYRASDNQLRCWEKSPSGSFNELDITYNASTMRFIRIRHDATANLIYWEVSGDNATWSNARTPATPTVDLTQAWRIDLIASTTSAVTPMRIEAINPSGAVAGGTVLWKADAELALSSEWAEVTDSTNSVTQAGVTTNDPSFTGFPTGRISRDTTFNAQGTGSLHVTLIDGDPSPYSGERAEVGQDLPTRTGFSESRRFNLNDDVWISFQVYVPTSFPASNVNWQVIAQWKQLNSTTVVPIPMQTLQIHDGAFYHERAQGATTTNSNSIGTSLGTVVKNRWTKLTFHYKFSDNPAVGFVEVFGDLNGSGMATLMSKTFYSTMCRDASGNVVSAHARLGIYRNTIITGNTELWFDGYTVATTRAAAEANAFA